ncbi:chemotaxis protein CheW [Nitrosovibrio tenuis]|uniref:CheW protein n=1 Tax=Nitrosovibrio tenuis TaxID=1233 RepID=A0A1H7KGN4_9PROT|nr:chemotaxis protein CheW [Nitrosovibrio tenuis]SEK85958.1 CheW protein [Nitrosovibrio tenuis]
MTDTPDTSPQKDAKPGVAKYSGSELDPRLDTMRTALESVWAPSAEETQRILQERALTLAHEPSGHESTDDVIEVLEFTLAYERYAVETHYVRQVAMLEHLVPLPCTPAFVLGIVNLRGAILPVLDLKRFFELPVKGLTDLNKIIVLKWEKMLFCILADEIVGVRNIALGHIQPSLPTLTGVRKDYLKGVTPERVALLDAEKFLASENIIVREHVTE